MKKSLLLIIFALFLSGGIFVLTKNSLALTISPPVREISGSPGETVSGIVKVYNETSSNITVYSSVKDFRAKEGEGGEPQIVEFKEDDVTKLSSWIKVAEGPFDIEPLDWKNIFFEIKIPENGEPGGHYAAIFFGPNKNEKTEEGAVSVNYQTGSLILLSVSGDVKESGIIKEFITKGKKIFFDSLPIDFEMRIENTGNVHFKPGGSIEIRNMLGNKVTDIPIIKTNSGGNVLPQSTRKYEITWGEGDRNNISKTFFQKVLYEWKNFHFGKYKAISLITLPGGDISSKVVSFWVFPWQLILIITTIAIIITMLFKWYNRWIIKRAREEK